MNRKVLSTFIGLRYGSIRSSELHTSFISRLSIIGLTLGVAILIMVLSVINGFDRELREKILALLPHMTVSTVQDYPLMSQSEWQPVMDELLQVPGISGVAPQVSLQGMVLGNNKSKGVAVSGINPEFEQSVSILDRYISGGSLDQLQAGEFKILIGSTLAKELNAQIGDKIMLVSSQMSSPLMGFTPRRKNFTVAGIFTIGSQLDSSLVYLNIEDAQRLYRLRNNNIHGLRIQLDDLFAVSQTGTKIRPLLPDPSRISYWTREYGYIYDNIKLSKTLVGLLLLLLVAVAAFNVVVSLVMIVRDKQGDIAILRTMGCSEKQIRNIFFVQGGVIGFMGTGAGLILGIVCALTVSDAFVWLQNMLGMELLSADVYAVNYLPSQLLFRDCLGVALVSFLLCLLATIYPAMAAARVKPAEALRHE